MENVVFTSDQSEVWLSMRVVLRWGDPPAALLDTLCFTFRGYAWLCEVVNKRESSGSQVLGSSFRGPLTGIDAQVDPNQHYLDHLSWTP